MFDFLHCLSRLDNYIKISFQNTDYWTRFNDHKSKSDLVKLVAMIGKEKASKTEKSNFLLDIKGKTVNSVTSGLRQILTEESLSNSNKHQTQVRLQKKVLQIFNLDFDHNGVLEPSDLYEVFNERKEAEEAYELFRNDDSSSSLTMIDLFHTLVSWEKAKRQFVITVKSREGFSFRLLFSPFDFFFQGLADILSFALGIIFWFLAILIAGGLYGIDWQQYVSYFEF